MKGRECFPSLYGTKAEGLYSRSQDGSSYETARREGVCSRDLSVDPTVDRAYARE